MERIGQKNVGRRIAAKLRKGKKVRGQPSFGLWATDCLYHHHGRIFFAAVPTCKLGTKDSLIRGKNKTKKSSQQ